MVMSNPEKLPAASSTPSDLDEAQENLVRCLEGLDQRGEAGLQEALDRIYPATGLRRVPLGPRFPGSFALVSDETPQTVPYSQTLKNGNPK
jgi:hypothetical protein